MNDCIFNLRAPPFDSGLNACPKLDANLKPTTIGDEILTGPGGNTSVRRAIDERQPLPGLHGYIHEAKGLVKICNMLCVKHGSEYSEDILRGALIALIELDGSSVKNVLLKRG